MYTCGKCVIQLCSSDTFQSTRSGVKISLFQLKPINTKKSVGQK